MLKPCPFCGRDDELHTIDIIIDDNCYDAIECRECGSVFCYPCDTHRELFTAWNKRTEKTAKAEPQENMSIKCCGNCGTLVHTAYSTKYGVIRDGNFCPSCGCKLEW